MMLPPIPNLPWLTLAQAPRPSCHGLSQHPRVLAAAESYPRHDLPLGYPCPWYAIIPFARNMPPTTLTVPSHTRICSPPHGLVFVPSLGLASPSVQTVYGRSCFPIPHRHFPMPRTVVSPVRTTHRLVSWGMAPSRAEAVAYPTTLTQRRWTYTKHGG